LKKLVPGELPFDFIYWGSYTIIVAAMGVKFGMEKATFGPLIRAKFHPIGATCRPCGAKNLKIGL